MPRCKRHQLLHWHGHTCPDCNAEIEREMRAARRSARFATFMLVLSCGIAVIALSCLWIRIFWRSQ